MSTAHTAVAATAATADSNATKAAPPPAPKSDIALQWRMPQPSVGLSGIWDAAYPLKMMNSLTRTKVPFIPITGKRVLWYMCGPTVYDSSHMGHARTYVCFDILRRIMSQFFGYDVVLTMNITDVEDKIIRKSTEAGMPYLELTRKYEAEFLRDMAAMGVLPPDALTRVSEYVPEIVAFVERLIERGFAYASNGSVYFATAAYGASSRHVYGKLVPEMVGNTEALAEGEGVLASTSVGLADKRDPNDFVLWKRSKEGEPSWDSPWGAGRPGWHIECSVMCGETLGAFAGGPIDIHSGGVDLRFPHHENEIAQSEAYYDAPQWVNYFLHSGHLHIEGLKMSKSLKNFIKISDALERFGARQLRLFFLLQRYNAPMNYSERAMEGMAGVERLYVEFFANIKAVLRRLRPEDPAKWRPGDAAFAALLAGCKAAVRERLADDFDTPGAMAALGELVRDTNKYLVASSSNVSGAEAAAGGAAPTPTLPNLQLLRSTADYVTSIFRVFGLIDGVPAMGFGLSMEPSAADGCSTSSSSTEALLTPFLDALAGFREAVRGAAKAGSLGDVLAACDALRDETLRPLGVLLEDEGAAASGGGQGGKWKLRDPAELRREDEERRAAAEEKAARKAEAAAEADRKAAEKEEKARRAPAAMFLHARDHYSAWDGQGVPTHDAAGAALPPATLKRLKKEWALQEKLHAWWLARQSGGGGSGAGGAGEGEL